MTTAFSLFGKQSAIDRAEKTKRRLTSEIVSRNPVLILNGSEGTQQLAESFYLGTEQAISKGIGAGVDTKGKNNSGIYFDTMVGPYPVHVPARYIGQGLKPSVINGLAQSWTLYQVEVGLCVAVFDDMVFKKKRPS